MNQGFRRLLQAVAVALAVCSASLADATTVKELPLEAHLAESDAVFVGSVEKQRTFKGEDNTVYTDTTFKVVEVVAGKLSSDEVTIRQWGGVLDEVSHVLPGDATFTKDEMVVVFVADREPESGVVFLTALAQSEYEVTAQTGTGDLVLRRDFGGLSFYDPSRQEPIFMKDAEVLKLSELKKAITAAEEVAK